ncbi:TonB-dependent receptor [Membranihabitans marinus]
MVYGFANSDKSKVLFADSDGNFFIENVKNDSLTLTVSYIGYTTKTITINPKDYNDDVLKIDLSPSPFEFKEIVITDTFPDMVINEDSIIYNAKFYTEGTEFKLREVLKKTPGFEVTREDEILYKGEKVNELLVEREKFFYGGTKLGVAYLPANVVSKIEVIEKYNAINALKGSGTGDRLAVNIHLDKTKNKFVFGDALVMGNWAARHRFNANTFYYSPKTRINSILDYSNSLDRYSGSVNLFRIFGFTPEFLDPIRNKSDKVDLIPSLLDLRNINDKKSLFGIIHLVQKVNDNFNINVIASHINNDETINSNSYRKYYELNTEELSLYNKSQMTQLIFYDVEMVYNPKDNGNYFAYNLNFSKLPNKINQNSQYFIQDMDYRHNLMTKDKDIAHYHDLKWIKKWNAKWSHISNLKWNEKSEKTAKHWDILGDQIPGFYTFAEDSLTAIQNQTILYKNFYLLNQLDYQINANDKLTVFHRLDYSQHKGSSTDQYSNQNTSTVEDYQTLFNSAINLHNLYNIYALRWDRRNRKYALTLGLEAHHSHQNIPINKTQNQFDLRPHFKFTKTIESIGEINLQYYFNQSAPLGIWYWDSTYLQDFNRLSIGNNNLKINTEDNFQFKLKRSSTRKGNSFSLTTRYSIIHNPLVFEYNYVNQLFTSRPINSNKNSEQLSTFIHFQKKFNPDWTMRSVFYFIYSKYHSTTFNNFIQRYLLAPRASVFYNSENFEGEIGYNLILNTIPNLSEKTEWIKSHDLFSNVKVFLGEKFLWYSDVNFDISQSNNSKQNYFLWNTTLQYGLSAKHKFELSCFNILDNRNLIENYFNAQFYSTNTYKLFPRYFALQYVITF